MRTHVALLKGINVGGRNLVKMADLRQMFAALGLESVETLLQSGNVAFLAEGALSAELEKLLEVELANSLSVEVSVFVRTSEELEAVIRDNPFTDEAEKNPSHLLVHFLRRVPLSFDVDRVQAVISGPELIRAGLKHLYVSYPNGIGTSTIGRTAGWNSLTSAGTARNWNTILKIAGLTRP